MDIRIIQVLLGQAQLQTTTLYTRVATLFASNVKVLDRLPPDLRARMESAMATNVIPPSQSERLVAFENPDFVPQTTRPAIISYPVTGQPLLFILEQLTTRFEGLPKSESDALLEALFAHLYTPDNVYRHAWRPGDLLIWDNIAVQHARSTQRQGVKESSDGCAGLPLPTSPSFNFVRNSRLTMRASLHGARVADWSWPDAVHSCRAAWMDRRCENEM